MPFTVAENEKQEGFPVADIQPKVDTVEKSRAIRLNCRTSGIPTPSIQWYKDFLPVNVDGNRVTTDASGNP